MTLASWRLALVLLLSAACSTFPKLDLSTLPKPTDFPEAKYLWLLDEQAVRFETGEKGKANAIVTERVRYLVLKPTELPAFSVWYDTEFSEIVSMRGRSILPDGTEKPLDTSKAVDRPSFDSSILFSNSRVRSMSAPSLPVGAIFETEVVRRERDVEPWVLQHAFGSSEPVKLSRVVIEAPAAWKMRWHASTFQGVTLIAPDVEEATEGGNTRRVFERKDIAALPNDPGAPAAWQRHLRLALRLDEWSENGVVRQTPQSPEALSALSWKQHQDRAELTPELEAAAREALTGVPDEPEAKARALYEYVCRRIQYCAIEIGYGGWIPHAAKDVHAQRWGDCKDKATYLHTLLKVAGVPSSPTTIYSHNGWPRAFDLPSLGSNFNHEILAVHLPKGTVYVDPTTRAVPFGRLPWNDADATVLEARKEGAPLMRTPPTSPELNVETHRYALTLDAEGNGEGTFRIEATGDNATPYKGRALFGTGKLERWAREHLWLHRSDVRQARFEEQRDFAASTIVTGDFGARRVFARGLGAASLIRLADILDGWLPALYADRTTPFAWRWLATTDLEFALTLPDNVTVSALPENVTITSPMGEYSLTWTRSGQVITATRHFRRTRRVIEPAQFAEAAAFREKVATAELNAVVLRFGGVR